MHFGHPERLSSSQREELVRLLKAGWLAAGFATELWTLPRIARLIEDTFSESMMPSSVWRLLGAARQERAVAERPVARARRTGDPRLEGQEVASIKEWLRDKAE